MKMTNLRHGWLGLSTLLLFTTTIGCSDGGHALGEATGGDGSGGLDGTGNTGTGSTGTGSTGTGGAANGGAGAQTPVGDPVLPAVVAGATQLDLLVGACGTNATGTPVAETLSYSTARQQLTYASALFRCEQELCGWAVADGSELHVLVQPCDLSPAAPVRCDCQRNVQFQVPDGIDTVSVWRRWDLWNTGNTLTLIGNLPLDGATPTCSDGMKNATETDIDCGGATCAACNLGMACTTNADCGTLACNEALVCADVSCTDAIKNGTETDVDCGGDCTPCHDGAMCTVNTHCLSGVCAASMCAPATCADMVWNGAETDVDCGGPECSTCQTAQFCLLPTDCASGLCADGQCASPI